MRRSVLVVALVLLASCGRPDLPDPRSLGAERSAARSQAQELGPTAWRRGDALAEAANDLCQSGQQNYKVDEIDFACTLGESWLLTGVSTRDEVAGDLRAMSEQVARLGCEPATQGSSLGDAQRYWTDAQDEPGALPGGRFRCADDVLLQVRPLSAAEPYVVPVSVIGDLTGGDVGAPTLQEFPDDVEATVRRSGAVLLWQVTASVDYAVRE